LEKRSFNKDPLITWSKVYCVICNQPTGPKSECYRLIDDEKNPPHKRSLNHPDMGIIPVFSQNCLFRQENLWKADINYPFSRSLLDRIKFINGIDRVVPLKKYTFQISIASHFDETKIKSEINMVYRTFIKEMQSLELSMEVDKNEELNKLIGIEFPNGSTIHIDDTNNNDSIVKQQIIFQNILDEIPNTKPVFLDEGESNGC
jgi:hypothetical protein